MIKSISAFFFESNAVMLYISRKIFIYI